MQYISTRGGLERKSSAQIIKQGLASDGGLFVPETIPSLTKDELDKLIGMSYAERAAHILSKFLTDYSYEELLSAAEESYSSLRFNENAAPVYSLDEKNKVLELRIWLCR